MPAATARLAAEALLVLAEAKHGPQTVLRLVEVRRALEAATAPVREAVQQFATQHGLADGVVIPHELLPEFAALDQQPVHVYAAPLSFDAVVGAAAGRERGAWALMLLEQVGLVAPPTAGGTRGA
jgi:hypothetical protein